MDIYNKWGFNGNPFETVSLSADETGLNLITARHFEMQMLANRLSNSPQIITIEGISGIGKSSLINVSLFRLLQKYIKDPDNSPLFIPCRRSFQLTSEKNVSEFRQEVILEIAQTIIYYANNYPEFDIKKSIKIEELDSFLNSVNFKSYNFNVGFVAEVGGGRAVEPNTTYGFESSGFIMIVRNWLSQLFNSQRPGSVVCILDNLELNNNNLRLLKIIEELRDELFLLKGLRWIISGSPGVVTALLGSPLLEGFLHDPIIINSIEKDKANDIFNRRISYYQGTTSPYLPLTIRSFLFLYELLRGNLRSIFRYLNEYCMSVSDQGSLPQTNDEKEDYFVNWVREKSQHYSAQIKPFLSSTAIELFKALIRSNGSLKTCLKNSLFSNSEQVYSDLDLLFSTGMATRLVGNNITVEQIIQITSKGYFVSNEI